jgi:hypothetical protein
MIAYSAFPLATLPRLQQNCEIDLPSIAAAFLTLYYKTGKKFQSVVHLVYVPVEKDLGTSGDSIPCYEHVTCIGKIFCCKNQPT